MTPAQLYHETLFGSMTSHYTAPQHLTMMPTQLYRNFLFGTITSHYRAP